METPDQPSGSGRPAAPQGGAETDDMARAHQHAGMGAADAELRGPTGNAKVTPRIDDGGLETPRLASKQAALVAEAGPLAGRRLPIKAEGLGIGRLRENDVVLAGEPMVSRRHAVIIAEQGWHVLYDRDSANGTWVNDQRIFRHTLTHGDRIQIGQSRFVYTTTDRRATAAGTTAGPLAVPQVLGEEFDGYRLEQLLGRGGMSEVYRARDPRGEVVAVKILQVSEPYVVTKFMQEGNKISPLLRLPSGAPHPNVAAVHKFDRSSDGRLYIVMEYVPSPSLRTLIGKQLPERDVVEIMGQVCSALQLAHEHNVVHRDIKPENILVSPQRVVKVLDFGIAKLTSASTVTRDRIVGTPEYLSPEQAKGDPVCPASDVYALGIVLYELLTGIVPFPLPRDQAAVTAALTVIRQHLKERPEPPRRRNPNARISKKLEQVALRALEKRVTKRYSCAGEMGEAMGYVRREGPKEEVPERAPTRPAQACLTVIQGPRLGHSIPLQTLTTTVGRADLEPSNVRISRRHMCINRRGRDFWLQDTSSNGTWVDNERVYGEVPLRAGAVIKIGETVLRLTER